MRAHDDSQKKTHSDEAHEGQPERGIEDERKVCVLLLAQALLVGRRDCSVIDPVDVLDCDREGGVREHPARDEAGAERLVLVVHRRLFDLLLHDHFCDSTRHRFLELRVDVLASACGVLHYGGVGVLAFLR